MKEPEKRTSRDRKRTATPLPASRLDLAHELPELRDPRLMRAFVYLVVTTAVLAIFWAARSPISEVITGRGTIVTTAVVTRIEHPFGGLVTSVLTSVGDEVEVGEHLVVLDMDTMDRERATLLARKTRLDAEQQRVAFIMAGNPAVVPPPSEDLSQAERLFWAEQELLDSQIGLIEGEAKSIENQIASLRSKRDSLDSETSLAGLQAQRLADLAERGSVRRVEAEVAERDLLRMEQASFDIDAELQAASDALSRTELKRRELLAVRYRDAAARQTELAEMITAIDQQIGEIDAQLQRAVISSPVRGVIQTLPVSGPGDVILPGELIAEIVPSDSPIQTEIEIPADRIGDVMVGMEARIKVATFDFAWFGTVDGQVTSISPTSALNERGESVYRVVIGFGDNGRDMTLGGRMLRPGMTVSADILGETKTVLAYLVKPLRSLRDRAFTES